MIRAGRRAGQVTRRSSDGSDADAGAQRSDGKGGDDGDAGGAGKAAEPVASPGKAEEDEDEEEGGEAGATEEDIARRPAIDRKGAVLDATWKAFDVDGDGVLNFDEVCSTKAVVCL